MRRLTTPVFVFGAIAWATAEAAALSSSSPRGVGPEFAKHYTNPTTFTCISHPSITVPITAVNDDYCDCPDGSDEPGTSACAHISPLSPNTLDDVGSASNDGTTGRASAFLPGFYCGNDGYRPSYLPHNRVNDGICDYGICCDGSDEWAQPGGVRCANRCKELGVKWRDEGNAREKSLAAAMEKKKELLAAAQAKRKEKDDAIARAEGKAREQQGKVQEMKQRMEEAMESAEQKAAELRRKSKVQQLVGLMKPRERSLCDALAETQALRDDARARLAELEDILSTFKKEYKPAVDDAGVKKAMSSWEGYAAKGLASESDQSPREVEIRGLCNADNEDAINWKEWEKVKERDSGIVALFSFAMEKLGSIVPFLTDSLKSAGEFSIEDFPQVRKARDALDDAENALSSIQSDIDSHKSGLVKDYWHNDVFRSLDGSCISTEAGEYTYELCWLASASQKSRKNNAHVGLGNFEKFDSETVLDASLAYPGKLVQNEKLVLQYTNGQYCWNGPNRSTKVIVECGEENRILKVWETEKCVYSMRVSSPVVCEVDDNASAAKGQPSQAAKDEL